jgi:hypothetical protein
MWVVPWQGRVMLSSANFAPPGSGAARPSA